MSFLIRGSQNPSPSTFGAFFILQTRKHTRLEKLTKALTGSEQSPPLGARTQLLRMSTPCQPSCLQASAHLPAGLFSARELPTPMPSRPPVPGCLSPLESHAQEEASAEAALAAGLPHLCTAQAQKRGLVCAQGSTRS